MVAMTEALQQDITTTLIHFIKLKLLHYNYDSLLKHFGIS